MVDSEYRNNECPYHTLLYWVSNNRGKLVILLGTAVFVGFIAVS
jgi:hypothetical protein